MHVKDGMNYLGLKEWVQLPSFHFRLRRALLQCERYPPRDGGPPYSTSDHWRQLVNPSHCLKREETRPPFRMLKQEKETAYKGGIMAFVHSYFADRFSNLGLK